MSSQPPAGRTRLAPTITSWGSLWRRKLPLGALVTYAVSVVLGVALWWLVSLRYSDYFLPSPLTTFEAGRELASDGTLGASIVASAQRILIGWALGVLVGVPVGLLMGQVLLIRRALDPYIQFFRFIPPIAFVTLAIIWFGVGEASKVVLIFYTTVFIIVISTTAGVLAVEESRLRAAASLGAGPTRTLLSVILPSTMPYVVTGSRLAMGNSFLTVVSAEIVAAEQGLGALIWTSRNYGRTDWVFVGIVVLGLMGFVFDRAIRFSVVRLFGRYAVKV
ncbi:MAG: ABC transporter permease [Gaiella sp.]|nr:ABC transporter permease [Gaiella sp.]